MPTPDPGAQPGQSAVTGNPPTRSSPPRTLRPLNRAVPSQGSANSYRKYEIGRDTPPFAPALANVACTAPASGEHWRQAETHHQGKGDLRAHQVLAVFNDPYRSESPPCPCSTEPAPTLLRGDRDRDGTGPIAADPRLFLQRAMWTGNLPALSRDRQVVTWDIRGHGRSDWPDDPAQYSEALSVDDMAALLDLVGADQAVVGGLSLGGICPRLPRSLPDRVAPLVVCNAGPGYRRDEARAQWNTERAEARHPVRAAGPRRPGHQPPGRGFPAAQSPRSARAARGILAEHDSQVFDSLTTISVPTLIVVGANDAPFLVRPM